MRINPQLFYERYQRGHHLPRTLPHWCAVFIERNQRGISPYLSVTNGVTFPVFHRTGPVGNFPRVYALDDLCDFCDFSDRDFSVFPELCSAFELLRLRFKPSRDPQQERRSGHPRLFRLLHRIALLLTPSRPLLCIGNLPEPGL